MGKLTRTNSDHSGTRVASAEGSRVAAAPPPPPAAETSRSVFSELVCGALGGTCGAMCVHPIDTVKTRMQAGHSSFAGPLRTSVLNMLKREGIGGFYRGITIPLVSQPAYIGATLGGMQLGRYVYARVLPFEQHDAEGKERLAAFCFAGAMSGVCAGAAVTPGERLKVLLQSSDSRVPRSVSEGARAVLRGGLPSVFRGLPLTVAREVPGNILWFFAYEGAHDVLSDGGASRKLSVLGGAVAAGFTWSVACTPFDRMKVMQQASEGAALSARALAGQIWRTQGVRGFFVGLGPTLGRNIPIDVIQFTVADRLRELFFGSR